MPAVFELAVRPDTAGIAEARHWLARTLDERDGQLVAIHDDLALVVSELATNALQAGAGTIRARLQIRDSTVEVSVVDDADGEPEVAAPSTTRPGGRGLLIVAALARRWGVRPGSGARGKEVWAVLAVPGDSASDE